MFCACRNDPDEKRPNLNICPVCMAHPGALPVINREAVKKVLLVGAALQGTLADYTEFDRKNYFYPDIPKGYQISQYKHPLVSGGELLGVRLTRVHLEEDTARSQHPSTSSGQAPISLIDFNRAGVPLMELVTEPVIESAEQAGAFARELQLLLRYLNASEANMEKGEMRVEANVSVSARSNLAETGEAGPLGTKVEVKNLNSFRSVERAVAFEVQRQSELLERGEEVVQETRGWDEQKQVTFSQRKKESSHDYRYFPDPDLPSLLLSEIPEFSKEVLAKELPELPWQKRDRYLKLGFKLEDAEFFVNEPQFVKTLLDGVIEKTQSDLDILRLASNYILSDLRGYSTDLNMPGSIENINPETFVMLMQMIKTSNVSSRGAKEILAEMYKSGGNPETIAKEKDLLQQSDEGALKTIAQKIIDANPKVVADYRAGKQAALQFLIGQGMKESKGSANPEALREEMLKKLR